ncbi:hypothetical protein G9A89_001548 [Geosiphon pyriformis]|nr:hypothetical protein G9A89_001548 [Geosiphon pyriformis]
MPCMNQPDLIPKSKTECAQKVYNLQPSNLGISENQHCLMNPTIKNKILVKSSTHVNIGSTERHQLKHTKKWARKTRQHPPSFCMSA